MNKYERVKKAENGEDKESIDERCEREIFEIPGIFSVLLCGEVHNTMTHVHTHEQRQAHTHTQTRKCISLYIYIYIYK